MGFLIYNIANFEAFRWNISLSTNLLFMKSDIVYFQAIAFSNKPRKSKLFVVIVVDQKMFQKFYSSKHLESV